MTNVGIYRPKRAYPDIGEPPQEPVSIEEVRLASRCDDTDEDALVAGWIKTAREYVETMTHRALMTKTITYKIDRFPPSNEQVIELPGGKLQSVASINYIDTTGANQLWDAANYVASTERDTGRIELAYNKDWPDVRLWGLAVTIVYDAGYGVNQGDVPESLRTAITKIAAHLSMNREHQSPVEMHKDVLDAKALAAPFRIQQLI